MPTSNPTFATGLTFGCGFADWMAFNFPPPTYYWRPSRFSDGYAPFSCFSLFLYPWQFFHGVDFSATVLYIPRKPTKSINTISEACMKRFGLTIAICIAATALGQEGGPPPPVPGDSNPVGRNVSPFGSVRENLVRAQTSYGHALGFVNVTSFGVSGRGYLSLGRRDQTTMEFSSGFLRMNSSYIPETYLSGYIYSQGLFILPAYLGVRYNIIEERTGSFDWSWFIRGGGGPAVGMLTPIGLGFFESLSRTSFHWGAGAYAATGLEFTFDGQYTVFMQGGADYVGFFKQIGDRDNFAGPSFSIGFGRLLP